jgi:hypothetical protein
LIFIILHMTTTHGEPLSPHDESRPPFEEHILEAELTQQCQAVIERFRKTELDKGLAMVEVAKIIRESKECTGDNRASSISVYFKMLEPDARNSSGTLSSETSQILSAGEELHRRESSNTMERPNIEQSRSTDKLHRRTRDTEAFFNVPTLRNRDNMKRKTHGSEDEGSDEDTSRKFDTVKLPWEIEEVVSPAKLQPELCQTRDLLKLYMEDFKVVKASGAISPKRPEFPELEWDNVIRGRSVDLNKVLSAMFIVGSDSKRTEHLGPIELRFRQTVPIKKVATLGEWEMAWGRTSRAITFTFPHRKEELSLYGEHISGLFEAINIQYHGRIILYDQSA